VICVAATDRDEHPSFYSNLPVDPDGTAVDGTTPLRAPGGAATNVSSPCDDEIADTPVDVLSTTMPGSPLDACPGLRGYEAAAGTSSAAPHVAGVAALLLSAGLDAKAVRRCLRATSRDPATGTRGTYSPAFGYGIVDAEAALSTCAPGFVAPEVVRPAPQPPPAPPASQAPERAELPSFARHPLVKRDRRGLSLAIGCPSSAACAAVLTVRAGRVVVARSNVGIPGGRTVTVRVRWIRRAPRARTLRATLGNADASTRTVLRGRRS
jgi:hypothetical protein